MRTKFPRKLRDRARERWYLIKEPVTVAKVLAHHRYWSVPFLRFYIDKVSALVYDDARKAATLVDPMGKLAERIRVEPEDANHYKSEDEGRSWIVFAWSVRSTIHAVAAHVEEARHSLEMARQWAARGPVELEASGEFYRRLAIYQMVTQDPDAIESFTKAIELFEGQERFRENLALAHAGRGQAYHVVTGQPHEAILDYAEALKLSTKTDRGRRTSFVAAHNLGCLMAEESDLEALDFAMFVVKRARREITGSRSKFLGIRAKLLWVEAMILCRLNIAVHAVRTMERARTLLIEVGDHFSAAVADVDIIHMHLMQGEVKEAHEIHSRLRELIRGRTELRKCVPIWWKRMPSLPDIEKLRKQLRETQCPAPPGASEAG